ncbi:MAG TPA: PilZ domain-containing protein [Nitrospirae bacterium]|nr:PilZ domain protein [bacterium BMS3Abin10]GBE39320.1 PilZ domain protein [bacterium BMS3Bbin08]HDH51756.1 PilZ domain-containing protein [Nitrospirota bacterium]HDK16747.1 PilZ domain-containing protein [Nitrospirota bacterium]HDK81419.1 PilZ domain-containing protein [Nitrospirota bacterium]
MSLGKRLHKRFETTDRIRAEAAFSDQIKIKNLSMGGLCIETPQHLVHDNVYEIELFCGNKGNVQQQAKVVWSALRKTVKHEENFLPVYEVGLKFVGQSDNEKFSLHKLITKIIH